MVIIKELSNGVKVALEEMPYMRSISFGIWVKNGSRNEVPKSNGVSHYIEHMLFKGTQNRSAKQIAEEMDALGGQINAYTTKEYTCYHTRVLDKHFDRALDVISDMFLHSLFEQEDIDREKNVIQEEIHMYEDAPEELVHDMLQENIWKECSLGMPILGTEATISQFTSESIKDYFTRNYHNQNTVFSVAGNFKTEKMLEKLEKAFACWISKTIFQQYDTKTKYTPSIVKREKEVEQVHICIAFPSIEREHELKYSLAVFNTIFGGGMSSRLFQKIREEQGLTYTVYSYLSSYLDAGLFAIYAGMNPSQTEQVISLILNEIKALKTNPISPEILNTTKEQLISNFMIGTESTANRMTGAGSALLLRGNVQTTEEIQKKIENITCEDIQHIQEILFHNTDFSFSAVGNIKGIDFENALEKISL